MTKVYKVSISFCCETPLQPPRIEALSPRDLEIAAGGACLLIAVGAISYAQGLGVHLLETSRPFLSQDNNCACSYFSQERGFANFPVS